jgi:D-alanyl-D-alanine dipeptidase
MKNESIEDLRKISIKDNGEPLMAIKKYCPKVVIEFWRREELKNEKTLCARKTIIKMLKKAQESLPKNIRFKIRDAWRPIEAQRRLYEKSFAKRKLEHPNWPKSQLIKETNKWTFPPDKGLTPGHNTGGALDLTLCYQNQRSLAMKSKKDPLPKHILKNRQLLKDIMERVGFSNYPVEWWHFSYGDSGWALRTNKKTAIYGGIERGNLLN